jgi:ubiquitin-protein ligase
MEPVPVVSEHCLQRIKREYDAVKHSEKNSCAIDLIGGNLLKWNVTFSGPVCHLFVVFIRNSLH